MKKVLLVVLFLSLVVVPLASAVKIDNEEMINSGETFIARISGVFTEPVYEENVYFYRNNGVVPFDFELVKAEGDYFVYASSFGKKQGNYSLVIKDAEYYVRGGKMSSKDIESDFFISPESADFLIMPGVAESEKGNFSLNFKSLSGEDIIIHSGGSGSGGGNSPESSWDFFGGSGEKNENNGGREISLNPGEEKEVVFSLGEVSEEEMRVIKFSTGNFTQKVYIDVESWSGSKEEDNDEVVKLDFDEGIFNFSMPVNSSVKRVLHFENKGEEIVKNVSIVVSKSLEEHVSAEPVFFEEVEFNESEKVLLNISSFERKVIEGPVKLKAGEKVYSSAIIYISVVDSYVPKEGKENENNISSSKDFARDKTCREINGTICVVGEEVCEGGNTTDRAEDTSSCCLSKCVKKEKSSTGMIIGIVILGILVIIYVWFYFKKYKKIKNKPDLSKYTKKK